MSFTLNIYTGPEMIQYDHMQQKEHLLTYLGRGPVTLTQESDGEWAKTYYPELSRMLEEEGSLVVKLSW